MKGISRKMALAKREKPPNPLKGEWKGIKSASGTKAPKRIPFQGVKSVKVAIFKESNP